MNDARRRGGRRAFAHNVTHDQLTRKVSAKHMTARKTSSEVRADSIRIGDLIFAQDGETRCVVRTATQRRDGQVHLVYSPLNVRGHATRVRAAVDVPADHMITLAGQS